LITSPMLTWRRPTLEEGSSIFWMRKICSRLCLQMHVA
jgi:hypothetical protein